MFYLSHLWVCLNEAPEYFWVWHEWLRERRVHHLSHQVGVVTDTLLNLLLHLHKVRTSHSCQKETPNDSVWYVVILGAKMKDLPKFVKDEISRFINQFHLPKLLMPGSPPRPPIPNGVDPVSGLWGAAGVEEEAELELPPTGPDLITKWTVIPSCEMTFPNSFGF